jgi:hypothetical protein
MNLRHRISNFLSDLNLCLFPNLEAALPGPMTGEHLRIVTILELVRVEEKVPPYTPSLWGGRPPYDRRMLARAFVIKAALGLSETKDLVSRLQADRTLRCLCGFKDCARLPSLSVFSRAFEEFALQGLYDNVHETRVIEYLQDTIIGHVSHDSTAIPTREKPIKKEKPVVVKRKRGRPKAGEERPAPEPKRLEQQLTQPLKEILKNLPRDCDWGGKCNSQGNAEYWKGFKLHVAVTDSGIPVAAITTSASPHDSQCAIPLMHMAHQRIDYGYDLLDSAYHAKELDYFSRSLGHIPIIDANKRRNVIDEETEKLSKLPFSRLDIDHALINDKRRLRYNERSAVERFNSQLKDNTGARMIRVRGIQKVHSMLMCCVLVIFADALIALGR